uniref:(+)-copalyl diphosphate synthase 3, chloroplastic n=1 Tax=Marrubium vulgare TaxID=41230 RepID=CPS3_MARVU|nr:RecName: Full=(+)-copalyl diphosphate synthase 3, chloroplastic; Short=MvCPS3; Flags: Precursor [Marrubium vulgare]AIE77092.1 (+)-copalyl diphosphate synthase [Marrubium vulgare]
MGSLSTLNLIKTCVTLASSEKLNQPSQCYTISTCMKSSNNPPFNYYQINGRKKMSTAIDSSVNAPPEQKYNSTALEHDTEIIEIEDHIECIRRLLRTAGDGRISVSPYDTAWIALIKDLDGHDSPQFPSSMEWVADNQLPDGSWGDEHFVCVYDRLVNTIACVVALRSWNVHAHKCEKGIKYIKENVHKLEDANEEHMTCGFEVVFPALLQRAQSMGIKGIPYNAPVIEEIYNSREKKLKRIPMEVVHKVATSLLFSLEGLENLEWEKLLKLQSPDGSFLTSPSSTAFAFIHTKDRKCFNFINNIVHTFKGGAPHTYPVDIFGRLWAVDRLQRLGISRFFESEIAEFLSHVHRFWSDEAGVFSGRESVFCDIDDTSMGLRLLRMHGYHVDPNVLKNFKQSDKFSCYGGQMMECSSPIYNLYRASQLQFPGEEILEEANKFAYKFLQEKLESNQILDKWLISNHLSDEIKVGLEMPWYATLPRVETSYYIHHYGGGDDVWIGKTLYRMPEISNDTYRELARLDFRRCQAQHQLEWIYMQRWYESCRMQEFGISRKEVLRAYFLASGTIFEVERAKERVAWARSQIISHMIKSFFNKETTSSDQKQALLTELLFGNISASETEKRELDGVVVATLRQFLEGFDIGTRHQVKAAWDVWLRKVEQGEAHGGADAELCTTTLNTCANQHLSSHPDYNTLSKLTNKICHKLSQIQHQKEMKGGIKAKCSINNKEVDIEMQWLVKLVLEKSGLNRKAKQAFLSIAKTYYYRAYYADQTMDAHIFKVLFEPVV